MTFLRYSDLFKIGETCQANVPQCTVWSYLVDLLQALLHLHEHNHIHMDIKSEIIFIGRDRICKVGNSGLMLDLAAADAKKQAMEEDSRYILLQNKYFLKVSLSRCQVPCTRGFPGAIHQGL